MTDNLTPYSTRLCLSGLESRKLLETFADFGIKHIQVSYYYLRKVFSDPAEFEHFVTPFSTVIIDSGTIYHKFKTKQEESAFLAEYAGYIGGLDKHSFTAAVYEEGIHLEKTLPESMLIYPLDIVRGVFDEDISLICKNIEYIGVGNKEATYKDGENLQRLMGEAEKQNTKVHLFGTARKSILNKYPIYSANSSSWRSGSRYLNTYIYEGPSRGLRLYQPTDKSDPVKTEREMKQTRTKQQNIIRVRQHELYTKIDWDELFEGDSWEVDKANLTQWKLSQENLETSAHKAYWLSAEDKTLLMQRRNQMPGNSASSGIAGNRSDDQSTAPKNTAQNTGAIEEGNNKGGYIEGEVVDGIIEDETEDIAGQDKTDEVDMIPGQEDPNSLLGSTNKNTSHEIAVNSGNVERLRPVDDRQRQLRQCDFCVLAGRCPKYQPGAPCSFGLPPENPTYDHTKLEMHVMEDAADLLAIQMDRIQQAVLEEKMDGAGLSKDVTNNMKLYMEMVALLSEATDKRDSVEIKAKGQGIMDIFTNKRKQ